jgi:hypothetical protein
MEKEGGSMIIKTISMIIRPGSHEDLDELDKETNKLLIRATSSSTGIVTYRDVRDIVDTVTVLESFGPKERALLTRRIIFR